MTTSVKAGAPNNNRYLFVLESAMICGAKRVSDDIPEKWKPSLDTSLAGHSMTIVLPGEALSTNTQKNRFSDRKWHVVPQPTLHIDACT